MVQILGSLVIAAHTNNLSAGAALFSRFPLLGLGRFWSEESILGSSFFMYLAVSFECMLCGRGELNYAIVFLEKETELQIESMN